MLGHQQHFLNIVIIFSLCSPLMNALMPFAVSNPFYMSMGRLMTHSNIFFCCKLILILN